MQSQDGEKRTRRKPYQKQSNQTPTPLHVLALVDRHLYAANHYGANTDRHHLPELGATDRHNLPRILAAHIQGWLEAASTKISRIN